MRSILTGRDYGIVFALSAATAFATGHEPQTPNSSTAIGAWSGVEEAKLYRTPQPTSFSDFGLSVALDGAVAVAGAQWDVDDHGVGTGAAFLFEHHGHGWIQIARLAGDDCAMSDRNGFSVAVSGTTLVFGAPGHDHAGSSGTGGAYVFERTAVGWAQTHELVPSNAGSHPIFGDVVAISQDTIAVSAPNVGLFGAVYVFVRTSGGWVEQARLIPPAAFADSLALDGNTLVMGVPFYSADEFAGGRAFVYERVGAVWTLTATLSPQVSFMNLEFGHSVAVHDDLIAVGAWATLNTNILGSAYVYERTSGGWSFVALLHGSDAQAGEGFGSSVAVFGDDVLVGANEVNSNRGAVYAFERTGASSWSEFAKITSSDAFPGYRFGVSLAFDGNRLISGANEGNAAYVFRVGWPAFCFGDGTLATPCPCAPPDLVPSPGGAPRSGCANSFDLGGARLQARGVVDPDVLTFTARIGLDYGGFALLVKSDGANAVGIASGDGVRCVDGALVRFGGHVAGANGERPGLWSYPNDVQAMPVSAMTAQAPAQTAYYQLLYRNAASGFCSPGTTNWTNAVQVDW